jgi:proteasome assembly chaperone (PAC2) family protein
MTIDEFVREVARLINEMSEEELDKFIKATEVEFDRAERRGQIVEAAYLGIGLSTAKRRLIELKKTNASKH